MLVIGNCYIPYTSQNAKDLNTQNKKFCQLFHRGVVNCAAFYFDRTTSSTSIRKQTAQEDVLI